MLSLAAVLSSGFAGHAAAQSVPETVFSDLKYAVGDILYLYATPFRLDGRGALAVGGVAALTGITLVIDDNLDRWIRAHPSAWPMDAIEPFRADQSPELEVLGSGPVLLGFSGGLYVLGLIFASEDLREAGIGCASAEHGQTILRWVLYKGVGRRRPSVAEGDQYLFDIPGGDWYSRSFYGGHAANIMTCASYFNHRFHLSVAEPVIMGLALGVGFGRVADRAHWLSDTVLGAAVGYFMGRAIAHRQLERNADRQGRELEREERASGGIFATHDGERLLVGWRRTF
jgi:membrane-associated phospholipid phosphatase